MDRRAFRGFARDVAMSYLMWTPELGHFITSRLAVAYWDRDSRRLVFSGQAPCGRFISRLSIEHDVRREALQ
jgi:hypothetical protein